MSSLPNNAGFDSKLCHSCLHEAPYGRSRVGRSDFQKRSNASMAISKPKTLTGLGLGVHADCKHVEAGKEAMSDPQPMVWTLT